jgi:hypothetical protein
MKKILICLIINSLFIISAEAKIKKIGNNLSIDIPDGYQYVSISLRKLLSRFPIISKDYSKKDLKELEEIGIGKSTKLILVSKNKKNIDFFNKVTTPLGYDSLYKKYVGRLDSAYDNNSALLELMFDELKKKNPNVDFEKISEKDFLKLWNEILNDIDFDKKYSKLSKMLDELIKPIINDFFSEYPLDEPSIIIIIGDKKIKDLDEINNLPSNVAYQQVIKAINKEPFLKELKLDERSFQIQKNKFGNMYMIDNTKNINVSQFFTEPQYSEFFLTTHKDKLFIAISGCSSKCNNSSTGTTLGLFDILEHANLFKHIEQTEVDISY